MKKRKPAPAKEPVKEKIPPWKNPLYKDKEKALDLKEKAFYDFLNQQRKLNKLPPINPIKDVSPMRIAYKYFIGKGNNSCLVKYCFKQTRWWWQ